MLEETTSSRSIDDINRNLDDLRRDRDEFIREAEDQITGLNLPYDEE